MEINYEAQIEAILFTMGESVEITKIAKALELKPGEVKKIVKSMQEKMNDSSRGIKIIELDGAYQMCTKPEMYEALIEGNIFKSVHDINLHRVIGYHKNGDRYNFLDDYDEN